MHSFQTFLNWARRGVRTARGFVRSLQIRGAFEARYRIPHALGFKPLHNRAPDTLKLEFGCGPKLTPGYVGVDIRAFPGVKYLCQSWEIAQYVPPKSITEIYSRHFFEHLTFVQARKTLEAWSSILQEGGILRMVIPDIDHHINQFLSTDWDSPATFNPNFSVLEHAYAGLWGWQHDGEELFWDVHKSGYNFKLLKRVLESVGFDEIERLSDHPWNLAIQCRLSQKRKLEDCSPNFGPSRILGRSAALQRSI